LMSDNTNTELESDGLETALSAAMDAMENGEPAPEVQPEELDTPEPVLDAHVDPDAATLEPQEDPQETEDEEDQPVVDEGDAAPTSWKRDVASKWADLPKEVKAEIRRRQADYHKGLEPYKQYSDLGREFERGVSPNL